MQVWGLLLFVLAAPAAVLGLCDPNATRGGIIAAAAVMVWPLGLALAVG